MKATGPTAIGRLVMVGVLACLEMGVAGARSRAEGDGLFDRDNLMAWCIVPFDAKKRGPVERVEMLEKLGFRHYAYDWRAEHLPTFDQEVKELEKRGIALDAVWFPAGLNEEAKQLLEVIEDHKIHAQLWVTMGDPAPGEEGQEAKVKAAVAALSPIADEAAKLGCRVELYNHGGWFGEPENELAIVEAMKRPNVGIVYNLHHGHDHLGRLADVLKRMMPHLDALNLNGMDVGGDRVGRKILPLGQGEKDREVLEIVRKSGYRGLIGILGHTEDDAEQRLADNLDGLEWLKAGLDGKDPGSKPTPRTPVPPRAEPVAVSPGWLIEGKPEYRRPPLTVECRVKVATKDGFNILVASDTKASADHWELFTWPGTGALTVYMPGRSPDHVRSRFDVADGRWHRVEMEYEATRVRLLVDGEEVADQAISDVKGTGVPGGLAVGRLVEGGIGLAGEVAWLDLTSGVDGAIGEGEGPPKVGNATVGQWVFTGASAEDRSRGKNAAVRVAEVQAPAVSVVVIDSGPAVPAEPTAEFIKGVIEEARASGDASRGAAVYVAATVACVSCHKVGDRGGDVGPALTKVGKDLTPEKIVEALFWPRREVKEGFAATVVAMDTGEVIQGYVRGETGEELVLFDPAAVQEHRIEKGRIEDRASVGSLMPDGLATSLSRDQRRDLVRLLLDLGTTDRVPELPAVALHPHGPVAFDFVRDPLDPASWPSWQAPVNRDRLYDFYAKEANAFRGKEPLPALLPEYPGLDGGQFGHWGNQNEEVWADGRWNESDLGNLLSGVFRAGDVTVPKGICVRLGDRGELAACFNPETLCYEAVWSGGFVQFSSVRHGFMEGLKPVGTMRDRPEGAKPTEPFEYLGLYRSGNRVLFSYRIGGVEYLDAPWVGEDGEFTRAVARALEHPMAGLTKGGPAQWPQEIVTKGTTGSGQGPYVVDTIAPPFENPWRALLFFGDHDFLPDGSAAICTMQGDVWRVSGLDGGLEAVRWRRIATGLHQPLGLVVENGSIDVLGRDQITRLHDRNGDGEADFYECVTNAYTTSPAGHDFICGLQKDEAGNYYTASGAQGLIRIKADGKTVDVVATGFRNPDGLGLSADGTLTVPSSEGEWTPTSMISEIKEGGHYGYRGPKDGKVPDLPMVYLPRGLDNSSGGQVFTPRDERWGPLAGQMIHLSFGAGAWFAVLRDEVRGQVQGAVVPMPGEFRSGAHRGRFNPADGQLYVSGMAGWGSYTTDDGSFQRVRYVGGGAPVPVGWKAHENGVTVRFSRTIDASIAGDPSRHFVQAWNYRYGPGYGSAEYSPSHPGTVGHDALPIRSARVVEDGRALFLELPTLQPVNQLHLSLGIGEGAPVDVFATVHELGEPFGGWPGYEPVHKEIAAHPILRDLATMAAAKPNPWRYSVPDARPVEIEAGKNLTFATRLLNAKAGEWIRLTFVNPDVVPHNWVLARPGTLQKVGELANKLVSDPEAVSRHYVPKTEDVLFYTDIVEPGGRFTISFQAPKEPGRYPYLCTFPGHWMVMNGVMVVEPAGSTP